MNESRRSRRRGLRVNSGLAPAERATGSAEPSRPDWITLLSPLGTGKIAFWDHANGHQADGPISDQGPSENSKELNLTSLPALWSTGKVWPRDESEPKDWTVEFEDPLPNKEGAPGLYGWAKGITEDAPGAEIYYDNVSVTANK